MFHDMQRALGGAEKLAAVRDFEQQLRAEAWDGNTGRRLGEVEKRVRWIRPNHYRADQVGPGSTYVLYFDGNSGWEVLPGTQTVIELSGSELAFARQTLSNFELAKWLADRDPRYHITSPTPNVVRIADGDVNHQIDITLDPKSRLPTKTSSIFEAYSNHPVSGEIRIAEWAIYQGIRFPRRWSIFLGGARMAEIVVEYVKLNGDLKPSDLAQRPSDSKPVLSGHSIGK